MRFDKSQFAQLITDQSGLDKETTEQLLDALISEILTGLEKNGSYTLKGFGQFVQTSDSVSFVADEVLALELNFEFAGLEPIEVAPPVRPSSTAALFDKKALSEEDVELENFEENLEDDEVDAPAALSLSDQDIAGLNEDEETGGWEYELDEEVASMLPDTSEDEEPEIFDYAEMPTMKPNQRVNEANKEKAFSKFRSEQEKGRKKNYIGIAATVIIAVLIALASWFVLKPYLENKSLENTDAVTAVEAPKVDATNEIDSLNVGMLATNIPEEKPITERTDQLEKVENAINEKLDLKEIEQELDQSLKETDVEQTVPPTVKPKSGIEFGLYGKTVAKIENSTTIVVHSLGSKASAERVAKDLANQDYKTVIFLTKMSDGQQFWRVGIGQFQNFEVAAKVRQNLEEPFKSRSFVAKITF